MSAAQAPQTGGGKLRPLALGAISLAIGAIMAFVAQALLSLISLVTNLAFFGRLTTGPVSAAAHGLGWWMPLVPIGGGLVVGCMARWGSKAIRGHGIPEAMEQVLVNESRIPARLVVLKPVSAAVAIGTGGPFGAEGPIIATGGAFGSLVGQAFPVTAVERKTLLAAGAAAGMSATFGCPVSAVVLAVELLLFELHPRSALPVALASAAAAATRTLFAHGAFFTMPALAAPSLGAVAGCVLIGLICGAVAAGITRLLYAVEEVFERLPIHWMWWPALGGVAVGLFGLVEPRTLAVGYENIVDILSGTLTQSPARLCSLKFGSWVIALSSGTSGGTLAPLMTVGAGLGSILGHAFSAVAPAAALDPRLAALVGMAALFAGASGATLACAIFAVETTLQPGVLGPLLGACAAATVAARLLHARTIMTEKIARRGVPVPDGFGADAFDRLSAGQAATPVESILADTPAAAAKRHLADRRAAVFPVVDASGTLVGMIGRAELARAKEGKARDLVRRPPAWVFEDAPLREAAAAMASDDSGMLAVVSRAGLIVGVITRRALMHAHRHDVRSHHVQTPTLRGLSWTRSN